MTKRMKPSGIAWIGHIPNEWGCKQIAFMADSRSGGTPDRNNLTYWENGTIPWMSSGEVNKVNVYETDEKITELATRNSSAKIVKANAVMVALNGQGKTKGMSAILRIDSACNQSLCAFSCHEGILHYEYLFWCFQTMYTYLRQMSGDDVRDGLAASYVKKQKIPVPEYEEQCAIADFLDAQCAKIDSVIADIEKQIETLHKYKKSLITEAVTKGLDRSVPMKASGNSWYSAIPKHWKICRIKDAIDLLTDYTANGSFQSLADNVEYLDYESFARVIRLTDLRVNMTNYGIYVDEHAYEFLAKSALYGGEILVANVGAYAGLFCEMPNVPYKATLGPNMYMIVANKDVLSQHYLYLLGQCNNICEQLNIKATASAQPKLNKADVKGVYIPIPPLKEQMEIERYLDDKLKRVDLIIEDKQKQLDAMQQYKKSLIYEYVTGKKRVTEVN